MMKRAKTPGEMKTSQISMEEQYRMKRNRKLFFFRYKTVFDAVHTNYCSLSYIRIGNLFSNEAKQSLVDDVQSGFLEEQLKCRDDTENFIGALKLNIMIALENLPYYRIFEFGLDRHLKNIFLRYDNPVIRIEAARVLYSIILRGTAEQADRILEDVVLSENYVSALLYHRKLSLFQMGIKIASIAASLDSKYRDSLLRQDVLLPLVAWVESYTEPMEDEVQLQIQVFDDIADALTHLSTGDPPPSLDEVEVIFPALGKIMTMDHHDSACLDACEALACLSAVSTAHIHAIVEANLCPKILKLLSDDQFAESALEVIENMFKCSDDQIKAALHLHALPEFRKILTIRRTECNRMSLQCRYVMPELLKRICEVISVLMRRSSDEIQLVMNARLHPVLVGLVEDTESAEVDDEVKEEAVKAIQCSFRRASAEQLLTLWNQGVKVMIYNNLASANSKIAMWCMIGLRQVLERGGTHQELYVSSFRELGGFGLLRFIEDFDQLLAPHARWIANTFDPIT